MFHKDDVKMAVFGIVVALLVLAAFMSVQEWPA